MNGLTKNTILLIAILTMLISMANATSTVVSVEDVTGGPGDTSVVQIKLGDINNVGAADIWLKYDKDIVIVEKIDDGDLGSLTTGIDNDAGVARMNWFTATGNTGDFAFAQVTLKAVGNPGAKSDLELEVKELIDVDTFEAIPHMTENGIFSIPGGTSTTTRTIAPNLLPIETHTPASTPNLTPNLTSTGSPNPTPTEVKPRSTLPEVPEKEIPGFKALITLFAITLLTAALIRDRR